MMNNHLFQDAKSFWEDRGVFVSMKCGGEKNTRHGGRSSTELLNTNLSLLSQLRLRMWLFNIRVRRVFFCPYLYFPFFFPGRRKGRSFREFFAATGGCSRKGSFGEFQLLVSYEMQYYKVLSCTPAPSS